MRTKSFFLIAVIWFLFLGGTVQAQQEKGKGDRAGAGQTPSEYSSYMGGKEHYLTDSPNYMAGKEHYLQGDPFPDRGRIDRENVAPISASKREMETGERNKADDQGKPEIQININVIPEYPTNEYGVIYLPVVPPKHHRGTVNPPPHVHPNPPQKGDFTPGAGGGFQQGTMNFR